MYSPLFCTILKYCVLGWCTWSLYYSLLFSSIVYREGVHGFSTILCYSVVLCAGMVDLDSLLFYTILSYCVQGWCTWILYYSALFCSIVYNYFVSSSSIVYRDGVHVFFTILYYSEVLCTGMVYMDSLLFFTIL